MKEKVFNYMQRSAELMQQGVPDEEAIAILAKEEAEADFTVLGSVFSTRYATWT